MSTFSISETARAEIGNILMTSECEDAVVALVDDTTLHLTTDAKAVLLKGMSEGRLDGARSLVENEFNENSEVSRLLVAAHERQKCNPVQLCEIDGIPFAMPIALREALHDYTLIYVKGEFMLQSPEETVANLRSVKALREWFK